MTYGSADGVEGRAVGGWGRARGNCGYRRWRSSRDDGTHVGVVADDGYAVLQTKNCASVQ